MPLWVFMAIYAIAILLTLAAAIWLLLHLTAVARTFAGRADIVPSPKPARSSPRAVRLALIAAASGLLVSVTLQVLAVTGAVNILID